MTQLQKREEKMKKKRKNTDFRMFLKEVVSRENLCFYKKNGIISRYPSADRVNNQVSIEEFENSIPFSLNYNFNISFNDNFSVLQTNTILPHMFVYGGENINYSDQVISGKNIYLSNIVATDSENVLYSVSVKGSKDCYNSIMVWYSENTYFCSGVIKGFNIYFSNCIENSSNIRNSSSLIGCNECIGCQGLINKSYCINNSQYSKDNYLILKTKILQKKHDLLDSYKLLSKSKNRFIINSQDITNSSYVYQLNSGNNVIMSGAYTEQERFFDVVGSGSLKDLYGVVGAGGDSINIFNSAHIVRCSNIYYSYSMNNCSFCIGCIGLKNKSFCILNKEYPKEEWYKLSDKIFKQMEQDGILGNYFSGNLNPFYFNDTMAYIIDSSFTKEEVEKEGYMWRDEKIKADIPKGLDVIEIKDLNKYQGYDRDGKWYIKPDTLNKVIKDEKGNVYRIVKMELDFLMKHKLPLPELHWFDRIKLGFNFEA